MRVLVVEDQAELAGLLRRALAASGFAADTADGLAAAEDYVGVAAYDAMVLDLGLPDGDGLGLLRRLRRRGASLPVLILTARDAAEDRVGGLDAGADDYVVKPFHMPELIARLRALLRRPQAALGVRLALGNLTLDSVGRGVEVAERAMPLSVRETALLEMLLRRQGGVVTREAIEQGLYSFDDGIGSNAMEVLVHRLRRKLAEAGASPVLHTVRGVGYMIADTP
jgi:DNA-binding response OmpR family regulator